MRFHLVLLPFFCYHWTIFITMVDSTNNSSINIHLYPCKSNGTIRNVTAVPSLDTIYNNLPYSCNIDCCISNGLNNQTLADVCQVTVRSSIGDCLGRLCYSGECNKFTSLVNITHDSQTKNAATTTTIVDQLRSSFVSIPWSSWVNKTGLTVHRTIVILLLIINISLTLLTFIVVIKSVRQAQMIAEDKSYRYTLL